MRDNGAMVARAFPVAALLILLLWSCSPNVGDSGQTKAPPSATASVSDPLVGSWKSTTDDSTLEIKGDDTFVLSAGKTYSGTWKQEGGVIDLKASGPSSPPINAVLSGDGQKLTLTGDPSNPFKANAVTLEFAK